MFIPKNYTIRFAPDLQQFRYIGREVITFAVDTPIREVFLDSDELEIVSCQLAGEKNNIDLFFSVEKSGIQIRLPHVLLAGEYQLAIEFRGTISSFLAGWYRSGYQVDGETRYIATTHFEPGDARRAFPCIDNPLFKATFDFSFEIDAHLSAVSNMLPIREEAIGKTKKLITFGQTPVMSTYLVYLGVGEFEFLEMRYKDILIRGVTPPRKSQYTVFALESAKKFLGYFEEYFGFAYPLPKLDLIAIADFAAGAMENWGAITFRETALLYIPNRTSIVAQQRIAEVIAHELAHQWFGNLVTMKWWDDLWLNESFATFMAYKALDHYWPEWHVWTSYLTQTVFEGMSLDSLRTSHPIQVHVSDVAQINELFDEIAYDKGGSILRMLEEYLSPTVFRDGLRVYIEKFQYSNAEGKDLWNTLQVASKKPVAKLMESFIIQTGFPLLSVVPGGASLFVKQHRFSFGANQDDSEEWFVPLVVQTEKGISRHLLEDREHTFLFSYTPDFVKVNYQYSGFYVTTYSRESFAMLGKSVDRLDAVDRMGILHDLFYSVLAGKKTIVDFVDFVSKCFQQERHPTVLAYIVGKLLNCYLLLEKKPLQVLTQKFALRGLDLVQIYPQQGEDPDNVVLRNSALSALALFQHKETLQFAREQWEAFLVDDSSLHQDLRGLIYGLVVWDDDKNYERVLGFYRKTSIQEERVKFLAALARTKNEALLRRTLDYALSKEVNYSQIVYIFSSASRNPHAKQLVIDWLIANWDKLVENGGGLADMLLRNILKLIIPILGIGREEEVRRFLQSAKQNNLEQTFVQVIEEMEVYSRFVKRNKELV